jgi:ferredoxin-NADP reductase
MPQLAVNVATPPAVSSSQLNLTVAARESVAEGVVALTLADPSGKRLPDWTPGAHIDLVLPEGGTRQYSLCGDRWNAYTYRVGVRREPDGRGGSDFVHRQLSEGTHIGVGGPRNNFRLAPAERYVFVAGGIGITPMLPMLQSGALLGAEAELL